MTGNTINSGTGNSGSFTYPNGTSVVACSFETVAKAKTTANDDEDLNNTIGETVVVDVLANDEGDNLLPASVRIVGPSNTFLTTLDVTGQGTWTVNQQNGQITFVPVAGFEGDPTPISYRVSDDRDNTATAKVVVTYAPVASNDESLKNEQGSTVTLDVLDNDKGELLPGSVRIVGNGGALGSSLFVAGQGTWSVNSQTGAISFAPAEGYTGNPTPITYQAANAAGATTTAKVTVTYLPGAVNDASRGNTIGDTVEVDVLKNDKGALDKTTVKIVDGDNQVTTLDVDGQGTWTVNPDTGAITFAPAEGYTGNPTPITYVVEDESGEPSEATVTVTYIPVASNDSKHNNTIGSSVTLDVLGNDKGALVPGTVTIVDGDNQVTELVVPGQGTWTVNPETGVITFVPNEDFSGNPTPITYVVED
ncbi:MAG: Ig-like domain-containing protein, partial [Mycetocola sp.]